MYNINSSTIKYLGLILFICVVFMIIVSRAYNYLPQEELSISRNQENNITSDVYDNSLVNQNEDFNNVVTEEQESINEMIQDEIVEKKSVPNYSKQKFVVVPELEPLESINQVVKTQEHCIQNESTTFDLKIKNAKQLRKKREFEKAIVEFQSALELTNDNAEISLCYEEIANTYAIMRRYGSAIIQAQKAYKLKPSSSLEFLLARLYYKTGNIEKATNRVDFILKKDFNVED